MNYTTWIERGDTEIEITGTIDYLPGGNGWAPEYRASIESVTPECELTAGEIAEAEERLVQAFIDAGREEAKARILEGAAE